ncbi:hypothetical protein [Paraburkholderia sp. MM6662-R1]|uniref:hypothetical protein n=1 Tax=Paraburkholderia sp. MM6662-R1 TaxID=2991066 RepID=UPI003D19057D
MATDGNNGRPTNNRRPGAGRSPRPILPFWIGAVLTLLAPPSIVLSTANTQAAWITAVCCLAFTLLTRAEDLAELSLGPLKAKMREQVREAAATVAELKAVAASAAAANLTILMSGNFMGGASLRSRLELFDRIVSSLREVGFTEDELHAITSDWRKGMGLIYHRAISTCVLGRTSASDHSNAASPEQRRIADAFQELCIFERWEVPSPEEMRRFLAERRVIGDAVNAWIDDYRHYLDTGEIRRRDVFVLQ